MSPRVTTRPTSSAETTAVRPLSPAALCAQLEAAGITVTTSRDGLVAAPRSGVTAVLADSIRAHKSALVRAFSGMGPINPFVCAFCELDFVSIRGERCTTCVQLIGKPFRFEPDSAEERLFLSALEKRAKSTNNYDNCPSSVSRDSSGRVGSVA